MLSKQTHVELVSVLERMVTKDLDRIFHTFGLAHLIHEFHGKFSSADKANLLLGLLNDPQKHGPYTGDLALDMLQYSVDQFYRYKQDNLGLKTYHTNSF